MNIAHYLTYSKSQNAKYSHQDHIYDKHYLLVVCRDQNLNWMWNRFLLGIRFVDRSPLMELFDPNFELFELLCLFRNHRWSTCSRRMYLVALILGVVDLQRGGVENEEWRTISGTHFLLIYLKNTGIPLILPRWRVYLFFKCLVKGCSSNLFEKSVKENYLHQVQRSRH